MFPRAAHFSARLILTAIAAAQPACSVYDSSLLNAGDNTLILSAGGTSIGGDLTAGAPSGGSATAQAGASGASEGGKSGAVATGGAGGSASTGEGGTGSAGAGNTTNAGSGGTVGAGGAGGKGGTSAGGAGGKGGASAGGAGGMGATGGGGAPGVDPCSRANWKASASESSLTMTPPQLYNPPEDAIDGNGDSRWSSGAAQIGGETFSIDLGAIATHLTQIVLDTTEHPTDYPVNYKLEVGTTTSNYAQVASGSGSSLTTITFADKPGRYLRITQTGVSTSMAWWSIHEIAISCQSN
jgi:hypothetical protein